MQCGAACIPLALDASRFHVGERMNSFSSDWYRGDVVCDHSKTVAVVAKVRV